MPKGDESSGIEQERTRESPTRRWRGLIVSTAALILALTALLAGWHALTRHWIDRQIEALREAGYPTTPQEVEQRWHRPIDGPNAGEIYADIGKYLKKPTKQMRQFLPFSGHGSMPSLGEPLSDEQVQAIGQLLKMNEKALVKLAEAAKIGRAQYPIDWSNTDQRGVFMMLGAVRRAANLLGEKAMCLAQRERMDEAVNVLAQQFALALSLDREPGWHAQLERVSLVGIQAKTLEWVINRKRVGEKTLAECIRSLNRYDGPVPIHRGLVGRTVWLRLQADLHPLLPRARWGGHGWERSKSFRIVYRLFALDTLDRARMLEVMRGFIEAAEEPLPRRLTKAKRIEEMRRNLPRCYVVARNTSLRSWFVQQARSTAQLRCARAALAIERYRLRQGQLPANPRKQVSGSPPDAWLEDPFTGDPLKYKQVGAESFLVYSVGEDKKDQDGRRYNKRGDEWGPGSDIPFEVDRVAYAAIKYN